MGPPETVIPFDVPYCPFCPGFNRSHRANRLKSAALAVPPIGPGLPGCELSSFPPTFLASCPGNLLPISLKAQNLDDYPQNRQILSISQLFYSRKSFTHNVLHRWYPNYFVNLSGFVLQSSRYLLKSGCYLRCRKF